MKLKYAFGVFLLIASKNLWSQSIGQLTITPANPAPTDTIYVISTLTYSGNCSYGLVYTNTAVTGNTILIMPTYCGYGSTTTCVSTDTFKIDPLALGNYKIKMEYHQGSICPISGFDATIGQADTAMSVSNVVTTQLKTWPGTIAELKIFPNPAKEYISVNLTGMPAGDAGFIVMRNMLGEAMIRKKVELPSLTLTFGSLPAGVYTLEIEGHGGSISKRRVIVQ